MTMIEFCSGGDETNLNDHRAESIAPIIDFE